MLLEVKDIVVHYGNMKAVDGISLWVNAQEIVAVIGPNGAGKSTTLRAIFGLLKVTDGVISLNGSHIENTKPAANARRGLAFVPQGRRVFNSMSIEENLKLGAYIRDDRYQIQADIETMLKLFPTLEPKRKQRAGTLSGGEQQMLAIARALMARPILLLLDEPSLGLSPHLLDFTFSMFSKLRENGTTILLVEQNAHMALEVADRGYVMENGQIVLTDTAGNLLLDEDVRRIYLGEAMKVD